MSKVRHIDFHPDEYVSGVSQLSAEEQGVYWMVCSLIYSRGGPIPEDHAWLARQFAGTHWRSVKAICDRLVAMGKLDRGDGVLGSERCQTELQRAHTRSAKAAQNGSLGGRPSNENKSLAKPDGSAGEKLTTNHQPPDSATGVSSETPSARTKPAKRRRVSYSEKFQTFWTAYPTDALMSKSDAGKVFDGLSEEDQDAAIVSVTAFVAYCSSHPDYRPVHAERYLRGRRFEGFNQAATKVNNRIFVKMGSPEWEAIRMKRNVARLMDREHHGDRGWWFDKAEIEAAMQRRVA